MVSCSICSRVCSQGVAPRDSGGQPSKVWGQPGFTLGTSRLHDVAFAVCKVWGSPGNGSTSCETHVSKACLMLPAGEGRSLPLGGAHVRMSVSARVPYYVSARVPYSDGIARCM